MLSGNRNFEARIHPNLKANFLASPPLVVAFAIAGNVMIDLMTEPVGKGKGGKDVYLGDIWPSTQEIDENSCAMRANAKAFRKNYEQIKENPGKLWSSIEGVSGQVYNWPKSTYIAEPPFFEGFEHAAAGGRYGGERRAHHGAVRRLDHHRPHLAGRLDQGELAGRAAG